MSILSNRHKWMAECIATSLFEDDNSVIIVEVCGSLSSHSAYSGQHEGPYEPEGYLRILDTN
jgi:hypothetical protein